MKIFFSMTPLQAPGSLQMDEETAFPIMTALHAFAKPQEEVRIIAIQTDIENCRENLKKFEKEVKEMSEKIGFTYPHGIEVVSAPADAGVRSNIEAFQRLIELVHDNDEMYACMTYGVKPLSQIMIMAIQYAYRLLDNASISCLVYGRIDRKDREVKGAYVNDMTALIQLDEITRLLAANKVKNPRAVIEQIISES